MKILQWRNVKWFLLFLLVANSIVEGFAYNLWAGLIAVLLGLVVVNVIYIDDKRIRENERK